MFHQNLKYLRQKSQLTQQAIADVLGIPRTTYSEYEKGNTEPSIKLLVRMADYYKVTADQLISQNISHNDLEVLRNKDVRVLATTVDGSGRSNIELVETRAEAGYVHGLSDPEYIADLPRLYLPLFQDGNYRAFEIQGDSMLPVESGSIIICKYVEQLAQIKNHKTYIVITQKEGVVYKRLQLMLDQDCVLAVSDNELYRPYTIHLEDIQEVWQYQAHLCFSDNYTERPVQIEEKVNDIHRKVTEMYYRSGQI